MTTITAHQSGSVLNEVLAELRARGVTNATPQRIYYLLQVGKLPRPPLDGRHSFIFSPAHVDRLTELLNELPSARGGLTTTTSANTPGE